MYVNPGELNKKIQIIRKSDGETYDDEGLLFENEEIIRECWAKVTNTSGTELIKAGSEIVKAKKRFLIRWTDTEITAAMIVRYAGEDHEIQYINPYGDSREYMEIWTEIGKRVV